MENDSSELTQPCLHSETQNSSLGLQSEEIYQMARFTVLPKKIGNSRSKRRHSQEIEKKTDNMQSSGKIQERIRLAAKGVRPPVMGQLSSAKILQELRGGGRAKKGVFFLCC